MKEQVNSATHLRHLALENGGFDSNGKFWNDEMNKIQNEIDHKSVPSSDGSLDAEVEFLPRYAECSPPSLRRMGLLSR
jgi:hypothetical protein